MEVMGNSLSASTVEGYAPRQQSNIAASVRTSGRGEGEPSREQRVRFADEVGGGSMFPDLGHASVRFRCFNIQQYTIQRSPIGR